MIILFDEHEREFTSLGLGILKDAINCIVKEEINGAFTLEMSYDISGDLYSQIKINNIIFTKPNPYDDPQPFRIDTISKPIKGIILGLGMLIGIGAAFLILEFLLGFIFEEAGWKELSNTFLHLITGEDNQSANNMLFESLFVGNAALFSLNIALNDYHGEDSIGWPGLIFNHLSTGISLALGIFGMIYTKDIKFAIIFGPYLLIWPYSYYYLGLGSRALPFVNSCVLPAVFFVLANLILLFVFSFSPLAVLIASILFACLGIFLVIRMTIANGSIIDD